MENVWIEKLAIQELCSRYCQTIDAQDSEGWARCFVLEANEFLNRRLTVEDAVEVHAVALERATAIGFGTFVIAAPTPFVASDAEALKRDAATVVTRYFPDAPALYSKRDWRLPTSITRVHDASKA